MGNTSNRENNNRTKQHASGQKTTRRQSAVAMSNRNSVLIIILSVIVIVAIIAGIVVNLGKTSSNITPESNTSDSGLDIIENSNDLELNKYPAVNELISNYRTAFQEGNTDLLKQVYNSDQEINTDVLTATSQIIEDYQNTQCYTKRGLNSGEYVVFVYDDLKLANISTLAPNLSVFYVKSTDSGSLYIYRGDYNSATGKFVYDDATQSYINNLYQDQDVSDLISTVNTKMDSACANDSDLMEFMEKVRSKTSVVTTPVETPSESESSTETETETETQTEATDGEA